jgi:hypothetical protein
MADCPNKEKNLEMCTCTYSCNKRGNCCECVAYHRKSNQIPGCFFSKEGEATYDRSIAALAREQAEPAPM